VKFEMKIVQSGAEFRANTKEPNTFWEFNPRVSRDEPHLFANCTGYADDQSGRMSWTKTYDGTAGADGVVHYTGRLSRDGSEIEGTWTIRTPGKADFSGRFKMVRDDAD